MSKLKSNFTPAARGNRCCLLPTVVTAKPKTVLLHKPKRFLAQKLKTVVLFTLCPTFTHKPTDSKYLLNKTAKKIVEVFDFAN